MKVNFFADFCYPGGLTIHQGELALALQRHHIDVQLCVPWPLPYDIPSHREFLETAEEISDIYEPLKYMRKIRSEDELEQVIKSADINHFHGTFTTGRPFLQRAIALSPKSKNIYTFHSEAPNPEFASDNNQLIGNTRKMSKVFAVSTRVEESVRHVIPDIEVTITQNAPFSTTVLRGNKEKIRTTILFIGRLNKTKGIEQVIETVKSLKIENVEFVIVGQAEFDKSYEKELYELFQQGYPIQLIPGPLRRNEMKRLYEEADIFYCPSQSEGGPLVVLEAIHAGCVILSTPVGIVPKYIIEGRNGFIRSFHDVESHIVCLNQLLKDKALLKEMQQQALDTNLPTWEETGRIVAEQYREVIHNENTTSSSLYKTLPFLN